MDRRPVCMCVRACVCECVNERSTDGFELGCDEQVGESERDKRDRQADRFTGRYRRGGWADGAGLLLADL